MTGDASVLDGITQSRGKSVMIEEFGVSEKSEEAFHAQVDGFNQAEVPWVGEVTFSRLYTLADGLLLLAVLASHSGLGPDTSWCACGL